MHGLGWSCLVLQDPDVVIPLSPYTEGAKLTVAYLTTLLVWRNDNEDAYSPADVMWLKWRFHSLQLPIHALLLHNNRHLEFWWCSWWFIKRQHMEGYKTPHSRAELQQSKSTIMLVVILLVAICSCSAQYFWYPCLGLSDEMFWIFSIYFCCLKCTSGMASMAAAVMGIHSPHGKMIFVALLLFFVCDHTHKPLVSSITGIRATLPPHEEMVTDDKPMVWVFLQHRPEF